MKILFILLFLVSCAPNSNIPNVTKINSFEYIIIFNETYAPTGSMEKLSKKALELCEGNYTIKTTLGHDKYGDVKGIHVQCSI